MLKWTQYSILTHIYGISKDGNDNPICKTEKETQMYWTDFWTLWEKARMGWSERTASKHVYYLGWNRSSAHWMHETSARGWCTGKTQRDWIEREVGGGIGMGNSCDSMGDSCQCMTKPTAMLWSNWPPTNKNKWKKKKRARTCTVQTHVVQWSTIFSCTAF